MFQSSEKGAVGSVPSDEPRTKNSTEATGDVVSDAVAEIATLPVTT